MTGRLDTDRAIVEEFRANHGRVGGDFRSVPLLLLTHTGAKTGRRHTSPLTYLRDGDRIVIFASNFGGPGNPAWYHNLRADPRAFVELGTESFDVVANVATGDERDRLFARQVARAPIFASFQSRTTRRIPVVVLTRAG
ncbi:nitroreductase family deazaflavin-dependent oxidoreductase [Actinoplanes sp. KI2]|uniref:nitroreductase family deazaflavin-dependent oxidoreductase n=1 Tax=Actinoplanes sp. KI2 TaxID=2983315 RepID=UPI0021D57CAC|nr:nitroreductase family deazaflavin-dependent oxidoreductase [Actinoplanes sp. KI2]MCU7729551.1 nitroreductase family deazaflavin-dependent oxidoreductase [Actinoplanes sp. KI2]